MGGVGYGIDGIGMSDKELATAAGYSEQTATECVHKHAIFASTCVTTFGLDIAISLGAAHVIMWDYDDIPGKSMVMEAGFGLGVDIGFSNVYVQTNPPDGWYDKHVGTGTSVSAGFDVTDFVTAGIDAAILLCDSKEISSVTEIRLLIPHGGWDKFCPLNPLSLEGVDKLMNDLGDIWDDDSNPVMEKVTKTIESVAMYADAIGTHVQTFAEDALIGIGMTSAVFMQGAMDCAVSTDPECIGVFSCGFH